MLRTLLGGLLVVGTLAPSLPARAVDVGARAPEIGLRDLDGRMVSLSGYRGKVVIVDVWASWCAPCEAEMPTLQRLHARYRRHGLRVVGVSVDRDEAAARRFIQSTSVSFRNVHDPDRRTPGRYGLATMPTSWIIDHRGIVRHVTAGFRARDAAAMERVVRRLLDALPAPRTSGDRSNGAETENAEAETENDEADAEDDETGAESDEADTEAREADGADEASPASEPPAASRSDAGRSGGLCSVGSAPAPYSSLLLVVAFLATRFRRRARRRGPPTSTP